MANIDSNSPSIDKGRYIHVKSGKLYEVIGTAFATETNQTMVVYKPLYRRSDGHQLFVRPYAMFVETIIVEGRKVPRFRKLADSVTG